MQNRWATHVTVTQCEEHESDSLVLLLLPLSVFLRWIGALGLKLADTLIIKLARSKVRKFLASGQSQVGPSMLVGHSRCNHGKHGCWGTSKVHAMATSDWSIRP